MKNQNVLALDLATKTGYAYRLRDGSVGHGVWNNSAKKGSHPGQVYSNFRSLLVQCLQEGKYEAVIIENVRRHVSTISAHVHGGLRAVTFMVCNANNIPVHFLEVGTIKKNWTGAGNAKKDQMVAEAFRRGYKPIDDNSADALAILDLILQPYGGLENGNEI